MREGALRHTDLSVSGVRSAVIEAGPEGARTAVVFVHGNPGSRLDWEDLVAATGAFARAVAFDMPGFGQADKPPGFDYSVPGYARFIQSGLEQLEIERVHLVVHDTGGWFGQMWAGTHPEAFASIVLFNTPPVSGYRWYLLARVWRTPILGELLQRTVVRPFFDFNVKRGGGRPLPRAFVDRMWRDFDRGTRAAILKLYRATEARTVIPLPVSIFRDMDRPALVVWGHRDPYIPIRFSADHRGSFPSAEFVHLERSGHWPYIDDPERVAASVLPFLRRQTGSPAT